jgi:hypothetical protein
LVAAAAPAGCSRGAAAAAQAECLAWGVEAVPVARWRAAAAAAPVGHLAEALGPAPGSVKRMSVSMSTPAPAPASDRARARVLPATASSP